MTAFPSDTSEIIIAPNLGVWKIGGSPERYHDEPDKNEYSHPHDALQYVATAVYGGVVRGRREGIEGLKLPPLKYPEPIKQRLYP